MQAIPIRLNYQRPALPLASVRFSVELVGCGPADFDLQAFKSQVNQLRLS